MKRSSGNVLFLILIAVLLFAALSYAVTKSTRGGGAGSKKEEVSVQAAAIMQYFSTLDVAVQRMIMSGVPLENLDWSASGINTSNSANSLCSTSACKVFDPAGGGVSAIALPIASTDPAASSSIKTTNGQGSGWALIASVSNIGTTAPEAIFAFRGVKADVCRKINIINGLIDESGSDIAAANCAINTDCAHFHGSNTNPWPSLTAGHFGSASNDTRIAGKHTFCALRSAANGNYVYHVVYPK